MTPKQFIKKYEKHGSVKAVAKVTGLSYYKTRKVYVAAVEDGLMDSQSVGRKSNEKVKTPEPIFTGETRSAEVTKFPLPKKGIKRYIFTSAQNNTKINMPLWNNLIALAAHYQADLHVARYTYMKSGIGLKGDKAEFVPAKKETLYGGDQVAWADELTPHLNDYRCEVAPGLVWCGEWQRLPTTKRPLTGYETYTGRKSGIFPHAKLEMQSVPTSKFDDPKFNYTTGTVTMRNYIVKGAGLQATFHHCYGALLVEVDPSGNWFCRQLNADSEGTLYDLDLKISNGKVTTGHRIESITFGDIHVQERDLDVDSLQFRMLRDLNPKYAFYHDILNFGSRNHHDRKDPFKRLRRFISGQDCVRTEVRDAMSYISERAIAFTDTYHVVVDSNHDRALERWLRESDWREDPANMEFFMQAALAKVRAIKTEDDHFHMIRHWFKEFDAGSSVNVQFLDEDESFVICPDANGGIEGGMHGHLGPNGARGGAAAFAKMGRKANVGHTHTAGIHDGVYTAGTSSLLDLGYNRGPSSWSHSDIITYENGKRAVITMYNGKYYAEMRTE